MDKRWNTGEPKYTGIVAGMRAYRVVEYTSAKEGCHGVSILALSITGRTFSNSHDV